MFAKRAQVVFKPSWRRGEPVIGRLDQLQKSVLQVRLATEVYANELVRRRYLVMPAPRYPTASPTASKAATSAHLITVNAGLAGIAPPITFATLMLRSETDAAHRG
jgi:hypothetical protein